MKTTAESKNIRLEQNLQPSTIAICDRNMIVTVLRNLVNNAIKFTETGGSVEIGISDITENNKEHYELYVKDTGIGMSEEEITNLFSLEGRTSRKGTEDESGTGLGLILCKEFIEKHGGRLWVESSFGGGSTFYFTLPK